MEIPVYMLTGFLESGKTSFIRDTLKDPGFNDGEKTLLLLCEEGFTEYPEDELKSDNVVVEVMDSLDDFTYEKLKGFEDKYQMDRVFIEYNGMWLVKDLFEKDIPDNWILVQLINMINAKTFNMYITNMRSLVYEHAYKSDMVLFNRCDEDMNFNNLRSTIKAINGYCQIAYESENGMLEPEMTLPYDLDSDYIDVEPHNYGIFCMDMIESPEKYYRKKVHIQGQFQGLDRIIEDGMIIGRQALVCCEDDTQMVGLIAVTNVASQLIPGEWVDLVGTIKQSYDEETQMFIGVLMVEELKVIPPYTNPYVTFD